MILFEALLKNKLTEKDKEFLDGNIAGKWVQNPKTGLIDVMVIRVSLSYENLTQIPVKFGRIINGSFECNHNQLTSLEGSPLYVKSNFECHNNKLTNLKYCPKIVHGYFNCFGNQLQSTKYLPSMIKNYDECIEEINRQKTKYLIDLSFDPDDKEYFKQLMDELENGII